MARREYLMKGKPAKLTEDIGGWLMSEKLDGMRCFWDAGVSRDQYTDEIPWARQSGVLATGLWSQYGNVIHAPNWWLNELPACFLDGELFAGRGEFQTVSSVCRKKVPVEDEWKKIKLSCFGMPSVQGFCQEGLVKNPHCELHFDEVKCRGAFANVKYLHEVWKDAFQELIGLDFSLQSNFGLVTEMVASYKLPEDSHAAWEKVIDFTKEVNDQGGEGTILRNPNQVWTPKRVPGVLKVKPTEDAEATIIGAVSGKGKYLGMVGNFKVKFGEIEFELSGFTDSEREITCPEVAQWAKENPGKELARRNCYKFDMGEEITFTYRELTKAGVPKEARYLRKRPTE